MSLQQKIVVLFLSLGALFSVGSYVGLKTLVFPAFEDFEYASATENLQRVRGALDAELDALATFNLEYSEWDHTYEFAQGLRPDYVEDNLAISYWNNIDLNGILVFDAEGALLWGALTDPEKKNSLPIEAELGRPVASLHSLMQYGERPGPRRGLLKARSGPLLISAQPILTSNAEGPPAGTLITARLVDPALVSRIGRRTGAEVALREPGDASVADALLQRLVTNPNISEPVHWERSTDRVLGQQVLSDVFGNPAYVLEVGTPRRISAIGTSSIWTALLFFVAATMLFLVTAWLFTRKLIVSPLGSLTHHITRIRETGDLTRPFVSKREDEIGRLGREFGRLARELDKATREIESARDQALAISNAKSDFLAKMSHEIRTPMNGVIGMVDLLANTPLDRVQKRYMHSISESADNLLEIISDILDFSKIEAGKLELETRAFDLNSFVSDVTTSLAGLAEQKGLRLNCIVPEGSPLIVEADPLRLRQVLTNLLGNAIKFTESGSVLLKVSADSEVDDHAFVTFEVIDTGIGIAPGKQRRIFRSFAQEDGSTTRRYGGTGLGLSICNQLVDMMGGEISLQSEPGNGSTFSFTVKLTTRDRSDLSDIDLTLNHVYGELDGAAKTPQPLSGRVLVAEDNAVNQTVAVNLLASMGVESVVASDGEEAVDRFEEQHFDAILMDCQMPRLDGFAATEEIRQREAERGIQPTPIIAITANAMAGDMEKCLAAGMDDYLRKPYKGEQLYAILAKVLDAGVEQVKVATPEPIAVQLPELEADNDAEIIDDSVLGELAVLPQTGDQNLTRQIIETYLNTSLDLMTRLGDAIDRDDSECIRQSAHSLKSSSANVGATGLAELCASIEMSTRRTDRASAATLQRQIREEYTRVVDALKRRVAAAA